MLWSSSSDEVSSQHAQTPEHVRALPHDTVGVDGSQGQPSSSIWLHASSALHRRGFTNDPGSQNAQFGWAMASTRGHESTRGPSEREKERGNGSGRGKKNANFWAVRRRVVQPRGVPRLGRSREKGRSGAPLNKRNHHTLSLHGLNNQI